MPLCGLKKERVTKSLTNMDTSHVSSIINEILKMDFDCNMYSIRYLSYYIHALEVFGPGRVGRIKTIF